MEFSGYLVDGSWSLAVIENELFQLFITNGERLHRSNERVAFVAVLALACDEIQKTAHVG